jgi:hypothetical protein
MRIVIDTVVIRAQIRRAFANGRGFFANVLMCSRKGHVWPTEHSIFSALIGDHCERCDQWLGWRDGKPTPIFTRPGQQRPRAVIIESGGLPPPQERPPSAS